MKLSIVIPCYNETKTIRAIVDRVRAAPVADKEIIIVDDCSRDGTRDLLRTEIAPLVTKIIYHEVNQGKGAALRSGIAAAIFLPKTSSASSPRLCGLVASRHLSTAGATNSWPP